MAYFSIQLKRNSLLVPLLSREQGSVLMSAFGGYAAKADTIYISGFANALANYKKDGVVNWVPTVITGSDFFDFNGSYEVVAASTSLGVLIVQRSFPFTTIIRSASMRFYTNGNVDPYRRGKKLSSLPADSKYRDKLELVLLPASDFDVEKALTAYRAEQLLLSKQAQAQKDDQEKANKEVKDAGIASKKAQDAAAAKIAATLKKANSKKNNPKGAKGTTKPAKKPVSTLKK